MEKDEKSLEPVKMEPKIIENNNKFVWNFLEIKANLTNYIEKYTSLVVTEINLHDMESAQKEVAGIRIKIDGFRKEVKRKLEEPYKQFETEIKELQALVEQAEKPLKTKRKYQFPIDRTSVLWLMKPVWWTKKYYMTYYLLVFRLSQLEIHSSCPRSTGMNQTY